LTRRVETESIPWLTQMSRPACNRCFAPLTWAEYLSLKNCQECQQRRVVRTRWVLVFFLLVAVYLWLVPTVQMHFFDGLLFLIFLVTAALIDIDHRVVLTEMTLVGAGLAFWLGLRLHGWQSTLIGCAAGFGLMLALYLLGIGFSRLISRMRGENLEEVALGFGDVYFTGVLGLILGWPVIAACLFLAVVLGGLFSGGYMAWTALRKRYKPLVAIPYVPFLVLAAVLMLYIPKW